MNTSIFMKKPKFSLPLDPNFIPAALVLKEYDKEVSKDENAQFVLVGIKRSDHDLSVYKYKVFHPNHMFYESSFFITEKLIKSLLWIKGGYHIFIIGPKHIADYVKETFSSQGKRAFDISFMEQVYDQKFKVTLLDDNESLEEKEQQKDVGRHLQGFRIGLDAGGSDLKVSAVIDGNPIFSEEIVWHPKINSDPQYHIKFMKDAIMLAASKMTQIDAIGISSAGVYINNQVKIASLFREVPKVLFDKHIKNVFIDIAHELKDIPIEVANDGDVTALAGAMSLEDHNVLGIAMGTSEAAGYVNRKGFITGWLNELAFVPIDFSESAMVDEWSKDYGLGVTAFSQEAVIKLALMANIQLDNHLSPAEKLKVVQELAENNHEKAIEIFRTIGIYLGYGLGYYQYFYELKHVIILGRVTSKVGGEIIIEWAKKVLKEEFSDLYHTINLQLPDEKSRRVGQSIAAASLPKI